MGVIALASDHAIEDELRLFLPPALASLCTTRVASADRYDAASLAATGAQLATAAALLLPGGHIDVLAYGCTSGSVVLGEATVRERLGAARPTAAATTPITAAKAALTALGARRIALLTPYPAALHALVAGHLQDAGFALVDSQGLGIDSDAAISALPAAALTAALRRLRRRGAEAIFASCTALRTAALLDGLEQRLGLPLVTSNQALAWHALRLAGRPATVVGRGRLLRLDRASGLPLR